MKIYKYHKIFIYRTIFKIILNINKMNNNQIIKLLIYQLKIIHNKIKKIQNKQSLYSINRNLQMTIHKNKFKNRLRILFKNKNNRKNNKKNNKKINRKINRKNNRKNNSSINSSIKNSINNSINKIFKNKIF